MKSTDGKSVAGGAGRTLSGANNRDAYQFDRLSLSILMADMRFKDEDPGPGDFVPEAHLTLQDGQALPLLDPSGATLTLLVFGSSTCPMTDNAVPGLVKLYKSYGDRVRFLMVNVREAHPGRNAPQPHSDMDKMVRARVLQDLHGLPFPVAIDDVAGTLHRALGTKPNSAYLISPTGMILFRAHWANDSKAIEAAIRSALEHQPIRRPTSGGLLLPMMKNLVDKWSKSLIIGASSAWEAASSTQQFSHTLERRPCRRSIVQRHRKRQNSAKIALRRNRSRTCLQMFRDRLARRQSNLPALPKARHQRQALLAIQPGSQSEHM